MDKRAAEKAQQEKPNCSTCLKKAATNEKREGRDRDKLRDKLEAFLTRKEDNGSHGRNGEKKRGRCATKKALSEAEQSLCHAVRENVDNYGRDQDQARTLMIKCWQSMQSRGTKNMNLEKDLEDIHSAARRVGGNEVDKTRRLGTGRR